MAEEIKRDEKPLDGKGLGKVFTLLNTDFERVEQKIAEVKERQDDLSLGSYSYCVASWEKNSLDPVATKQYGNPDLLRRWDFYLVDHDKLSEDGKACVPVAKLKRNNIFRDQYGQYAKTVFTNLKCKGLYNIQGDINSGYTAKSVFSMDGSTQLFDNSACSGSPYATVATFNSAKFWEEKGHAGKLYIKVSSTIYEVTNIPRPWEEYQQDGKGFDKLQSVVMSYPKTCYLLDQLEGNSGKIWKGIFFEPTIWDGIDVSRFPLNPTGIGPTPATAVASTGTSSTASKTSSTANGDKMFTRYVEFYKEPSTATGTDGLRMGTNCQGHLGEGNISKAFMSEDWTIDGVKYKRFIYGRSYDVSQLTNCNMARNSNPDPQKPYPFAEGGYHSRNVFVSSQETIYQTKYLNETGFFASGISANDAVENEAQWKAYGGIRWQKQGSSTWNYGTWNTTPEGLYYNTSKGATHFNALLSWWFPKEQVLESQTAASYAAEAGIDEGVEFEWAGKTWWYKNVPGAPGLKDGEMNCIIYKKIPYTFKGYDDSLASTTWNMEIILRMSLMNGYNHSGDYWIYYGGGYEQVGTVTNVTNGTTGNPVDIWICFDQSKWRSTAELQTVSINNLGTFVFEQDPNYWKAWSGLNLGDSYTAERPSYTAYKSKEGGSLGTGECYWSYCSKHWSTTLNQRIRVGIHGRGNWSSNAGLGFSGISIRDIWARSESSFEHTRDFGGSVSTNLDLTRMV